MNFVNYGRRKNNLSFILGNLKMLCSWRILFGEIFQSIIFYFSIRIQSFTVFPLAKNTSENPQNLLIMLSRKEFQQNALNNHFTLQVLFFSRNQHNHKTYLFVFWEQKISKSIIEALFLMMCLC